MLECVGSVGATYKCPNHKDIGGDLFNVNAKNYKMRNLEEATVDGDTFGLSMLGDGATIKMAFFDAMVLNGNFCPVVAAIKD